MESLGDALALSSLSRRPSVPALGQGHGHGHGQGLSHNQNQGQGRTDADAASHSHTIPPPTPRLAARPRPPPAPASTTSTSAISMSSSAASTTPRSREPRVTKQSTSRSSSPTRKRQHHMQLAMRLRPQQHPQQQHQQLLLQQQQQQREQQEQHGKTIDRVPVHHPGTPGSEGLRALRSPQLAPMTQSTTPGSSQYSTPALHTLRLSTPQEQRSLQLPGPHALLHPNSQPHTPLSPSTPHDPHSPSPFSMPQWQPRDSVAFSDTASTTSYTQSTTSRSYRTSITPSIQTPSIAGTSYSDGAAHGVHQHRILYNKRSLPPLPPPSKNGIVPLWAHSAAASQIRASSTYRRQHSTKSLRSSRSSAPLSSSHSHSGMALSQRPKEHIPYRLYMARANYFLRKAASHGVQPYRPNEVELVGMGLYDDKEKLSTSPVAEKKSVLLFEGSAPAKTRRPEIEEQPPVLPPLNLHDNMSEDENSADESPQTEEQEDSRHARFYPDHFFAPEKSKDQGVDWGQTDNFGSLWLNEQAQHVLETVKPLESMDWLDTGRQLGSQGGRPGLGARSMSGSAAAAVAAQHWAAFAKAAPGAPVGETALPQLQHEQLPQRMDMDSPELTALPPPTSTTTAAATAASNTANNNTNNNSTTPAALAPMLELYL